MSGAVVVLRPAAASAMVWRFAGSVIRAARSRSRHGLWVLTKKRGWALPRPAADPPTTNGTISLPDLPRDP